MSSSASRAVSRHGWPAAQGRQQPLVRIGAGAGRDAAEQRGVFLLRGPVRSPTSSPPWWAITGPTRRLAAAWPSGPRRCARSQEDVQDSIASITASITAQAIGPPPNVVPSASSFSAVVAGGIGSAAHGKPAVPWRWVILLQPFTMPMAANGGWPHGPCRIGRSSRSAVPTASQRAQRTRGTAPPGRMRRHYRLDDHRGGVVATHCSRRMITAQDEAIERRAREAVPWQPRGDGASAAVRPWSRCSMAATLRTT